MTGLALNFYAFIIESLNLLKRYKHHIFSINLQIILSFTYSLTQCNRFLFQPKTQ